MELYIIPEKYRTSKCECGCSQKNTHAVMVSRKRTLFSGCEFSARKWLKDNYSQLHVKAKKYEEY